MRARFTDVLVEGVEVDGEVGGLVTGRVTFVVSVQNAGDLTGLLDLQNLSGRFATLLVWTPGDGPLEVTSETWIEEPRELAPG